VQGIIKAMTGNANFPNPTPTLAAFQQAVTDLQTAQLAAQGRGAGAVTTRTEKRTALCR
jgi:hypothetical protein